MQSEIALAYREVRALLRIDHEELDDASLRDEILSILLQLRRAADTAAARVRSNDATTDNGDLEALRSLRIRAEELRKEGKRRLRKIRVQSKPNRDADGGVRLTAVSGFVYLSESSPDVVEPIMASLESVLREFAIPLPDYEPPVIASYLQRVKLRGGDRGLRERLEKVESALEVAILRQPMAVENETQATAIASLIAAIENVPTATMLVGSALVMKRDGSLFVQTLTAAQRRQVEKEPGLWQVVDEERLLQVWSLSTSPPRRPRPNAVPIVEKTEVRKQPAPRRKRRTE